MPILRIPKTNISIPCDNVGNSEETVDHSESLVFKDQITDSIDKKGFSVNENPETLLQSLFVQDSEEFKRQIRHSSKLCKSYVCSRKFTVESTDDEFWLAAINEITCIGAQKKAWKNRKGKNNLSVENKSDSDVITGEIFEDNFFNGNIKIIIKDRPIVDTKEDVLEILRKSFEALRINAQKNKRLEELKTKVQERIAEIKLRRYFDAWRNRVLHVKTLEEKKQEKQELSNERKIEIFINAISEKQKELKRVKKSVSPLLLREKLELNERYKSTSEELFNNVHSIKGNFKLNNSYKTRILNSQTRFQIQRKIIEKQRSQLAEQNKIIEELKLNEIEKFTKKVEKDTINVAKSALALCSSKNRRSLMHILREQGYRDKSFVSPKVPETPDFLMRMEARAEARRERVRKSKEARLQRIENEKVREEELRRKEETKRRRLKREAQQEAKRVREEREKKRIQDIERTKFLIDKADKFNKCLTLRHYIFRPLISLILKKHENYQRAKDYHNRKLMKKNFTDWKLIVNRQNEIKEELARLVYHRNLLWYYLIEWKKFTVEQMQKRHVASDFYEMKIQERVLKEWRLKSLEMKIVNKKNCQVADNFYEKKLKMRHFRMWRKFPKISEQVKDSERQKNEWRALIQTIIPNFQPRQRGVAIDD